uniref:Uncharacterized protein n=1 Tax=Manihot esculenta TaxID=3983 RepID=A0A2C9UL15_MANES
MSRTEKKLGKSNNHSIITRRGRNHVRDRTRISDELVKAERALLRRKTQWPCKSAFAQVRKKEVQTIFYKLRSALRLNGFASHQLKLIQWVTRKHFEDLSYVRFGGETSCSQHLVVYTDSKNDRDLLMKEVKDDCLKRGRDENQSYNWVSPCHRPSLFCTKVDCGPQLLFRYSNNARLPRMKKSSTSLSSAFSLLYPQIAVNSNKNHDLTFRPCVNVEVQVNDTSLLLFFYSIYSFCPLIE